MIAEFATALEIERPPIGRFLDANDQGDVFVMTARDCPHVGVNTFATVGLSEHALMTNGADFGTRVEFIAACGTAFSGLDAVISTAAFGVINSKWFCAPGIIFPGVVSMHPGVSKTMSDVYFAYPFLWGMRLNSTTLSGHTVAWLQVVPVSKRETAFALAHGSEKLEQLFERSPFDIFDLNRPSVV